MNRFKPSTLSHDADARVTRFALRLTAGLTERSATLPHDVAERLRFSREQALAAARTARAAQTVPATSALSAPSGVGLALGGAAGGGRSSSNNDGWFKWASLLPLALLLVGLLLVHQGQRHEQVLAAAQVDTALLSDNLPPTAYSDPGFAEFLRDEQE